MADEKERIALLDRAEEKNDKAWYKIRVYRSHLRPGVLYDVLAYVFAADAVEVLDRYKIMPGVKHVHPEGGRYPDISLVSPEEVQKLEREIVNGGRIPLSAAKKTWYYSVMI
jgi:hypothetical protein